MAKNAITANTFLFIEIEDISGFNKDLRDNNIFWNNLKSMPPVRLLNNNLSHFDSLTTQDADIKELIDQGNFTLAIQNNGKKTSILYLFELPGRQQNSTLNNFILKLFGNNYKHSKISLSGKKVNKLVTDKNISFFWRNSDGLFLGSRDSVYLNEAINHLENKSNLPEKEAFKQVEKTAGKNVDARLFINLNQLNNLYKLIFSGKIPGQFPDLHFASWNELDILLKEDELLLNGYTTTADSSRYYLNIFSNQRPCKTSLTAVLPFNTNFFIWQGFESYNSYHKNRILYLKKAELFQKHEAGIKNLEKKYKINTAEQFYNQIDNEVCLASTAENKADFEEKSFAVIKLNDPLVANQQLTAIMHQVNGSKTIERHHDYLIKKINIPQFIPKLLGNMFSAIHNTYFIIIDHYAIVSNNTGILKEIINTYISGKVLTDNINYQEFSDNISENSNLYIYLNIRNASSICNKVVNSSIANFIKDYESEIKKFHAVGLQFSSVNQMFYTNACIKYNPEYREESRALWITSLDSKIISKPYLVKDHTDRTYNIIVFDEDKQMYLIDNNGNILWKKKLDSNINSFVFPVDYYKNRKIQYLFNTDQNLYLIDLLGRDVANYPIRFSQPISGGLSLFDYTKNKNYRIVFAGNDNRIYNYDIKGNSVNGWINPKMQSNPEGEIQHLLDGNRDYIFVPVESGNINILNRRGKQRIEVKGNINNAEGSAIYLNKTNSKGNFLTTDKQGHLIYISTSGKLNKTVFKDFSPEHFFLYEDFNKDGHRDFIYLDGNILNIFDRFKNLIFDYKFDNLIKIKPVFIPLSYKENLLAIVSSDDNQIYLFNSKGEQVFGTGMVGETPVSIGSLNNNKQLNLIVGSGSSLYNYLIN